MVCDTTSDGHSVPFCRRHVALNRLALIEGFDYVFQPGTFFLRSAWQEVKGLDSGLRFCMDWDIIIRIATRYPAVLINEFLAVSREHEGTKTASGGMSRLIELVRMIQSHTKQEITAGSLYYLLETLLEVTGTSTLGQLRYHLYEGMKAIEQHIAERYGSRDGFQCLPTSRTRFTCLSRVVKPRFARILVIW
jgi:hypothetical protein